MADITKELYEKFNRLFPEPMTLPEIAAELDRMDPQEAEEYDSILCCEVFRSFCLDYLRYEPGTAEIITSSDDYRIFRRRAANFSSHNLYDAWCAFLEGRKQAVGPYIRAYFQVFADAEPPFGETDLGEWLLLGFKNAWPGFWKTVKREMAAVPHDELAEELCDVIEAFYNAPTNEDALEVLISAYQQYPESRIVNEMLGAAYLDGKRYGNAAAAFERLYDEKDECYNAVLFRQDVICCSQGYANDMLKDRKTAIAYYKKAVEINPWCPSAAHNLSLAYYRERRYDEAYAILKRCIDEGLQEDLSGPVANLARVLYAMGRYREAKEFIKTAPARVPKGIREKIEKAPDADAAKSRPVTVISEDEENTEPEMRPAIGRKGVQFQSERVLEDELVMRMEAGLEVFGLPLKIYRRKGEYGRQYIFPQGRLDILAEDAAGDLYIIELKKDSGYDDVYKQTAAYIDWFEKHRAKGRRVYGIICLNDPGKKLIDAVRKDERVRLFEYQIACYEIN